MNAHRDFERPKGSRGDFRDFSLTHGDPDYAPSVRCTPSSRHYAQTNVQLFATLSGDGYGDLDVLRIGDAYTHAQQLFAAQFRGSGRPFLAHLVGTASILAKHGASPNVVIAGLLHAAYEHGDFGSALRGPTSAKRRKLIRVIGPEAESLVSRYTALRWTPAAISGFSARAAPLTQDERDVLFIRLANDLEDGLRDNFVFSALGKQRTVAECLPASANLADNLGFANLAEELRLCAEIAQMPLQAPLCQSVGDASYPLVPASCTLRTLPRLVRALKRLERTLPKGARQKLNTWLASIGSK